MKVHFEARRSSEKRTCQAQARSDSLLFRNGLAVTLRHVGVPFFLAEEVPKERRRGRGAWGVGVGALLRAKGPGKRRNLRGGETPPRSRQQGWCEGAPTWPEAALGRQPRVRSCRPAHQVHQS